MTDVLLSSWERSLRARRRAEGTITAYLLDVAAFERWLAARHKRTTLATARAGMIEAFLAELTDDGKAAATVARKYRSLQQFYRWMLREDEITASPMARLSPPKVPVQPPPIVRTDEMKALLAVCTGNGFEERRDRAMLLILWTTGVRAGELVGLAVEDVDLKHDTFTVLGKGGSMRTLELLPRPAEAVDRYLRSRAQHAAARRYPALWLGRRGPMTTSGLTQMIERRCGQAGVTVFSPHKLRHSFAHYAKVKGMADDALMQIAGWRSQQMVARYGASAAAERARASHRALFANDDL